MAGFIYLIATECGEFVKIGFTKGKPMKRLASLQTGSPQLLRLLGYFRGDVSDEMRLHRVFASLRCQGEWFRLRMKLADFVYYINGCGGCGLVTARMFQNAIYDCLDTSMRHPDSQFSELEYEASADLAALR